MDATGQTGPLDRGRARLRLIHEIATGNHSYAALARQHGVTRSAISQFAARHQLAILDARQALDDDTAALWVSRRRDRLAEIQQTIEDLDAQLDAQPEDRAQLWRLRLQAIRQAAEETGQLRDTAPVHTVEIRLNGVDLDQLT
jgi:transposase-like protein